MGLRQVAAAGMVLFAEHASGAENQGQLTLALTEALQQQSEQSLTRFRHLVDEHAVPDDISNEIAAAASFCHDAGGDFFLEAESLQRVDLDGDGTPDWALNSSGFACSTMASPYCGTAGCPTLFVVGDDAVTLVNFGWNISAQTERRFVLEEQDGDGCNTAAPCFAMVIYDAASGAWDIGEPDAVD